MTDSYLHLGQTYKTTHSSSTKAIKSYGHAAVLIDEEQLTKEKQKYL